MRTAVVLDLASFRNKLVRDHLPGLQTRQKLAADETDETDDDDESKA